MGTLHLEMTSDESNQITESISAGHKAVEKKEGGGAILFWANWPFKESMKGSRFVCLAVFISCRCKAILMSVAPVTISQWAENLFPLPPRWPGWRFNFVEVLADYRYLSAAVTENAAQAGSEQGAGTLIRTAALGRFPQREQWDRASKDALDVRWKHWDHPHCSTLAGIQASYYLIGSLQAGRPSTFVGGIKELKGCILIGFTGPGKKKISKQIDKRKKAPSPLDLLQKKH